MKLSPDIWYMFVGGPDKRGTIIWKCVGSRVFQVTPTTRKAEGTKGEPTSFIYMIYDISIYVALFKYFHSTSRSWKSNGGVGVEEGQRQDV
jgi:hypothetical protein